MDITDCVKVQIDLAQVANNLRLPGGGTAGEATARAFLQHAGFNPDEDGTWVGPRSGLRCLNYSEVIRVQALGM